MNSIVSEKRYISERLGVPYENLSQGYLRAETPLDGGTFSTLDFTLQTNKKVGAFVTERLLDLNDEFVITNFTVGLVDADTSSTDLEHLTAVVQTFSDPATFGATFQTLNSIYNGSLNFTIDRTEFIPDFPTSAFKRVPLTQINSANGGTAPVQNGFSNGLYGFNASEPTRINGRQTIDLSIDLGTAISFASLAAVNPAVVFEARGYLVVNAK
jgi:hypothetical protein|tara:strand:+ start:533 stop:1171 length:639 start_codon:yes stop_codon:yes gene_type:complete